MLRIFRMTVACALLFTFTGCGRDVPVGVIDMLQVAKALGRDKVINEQLAEYKKQLGAKIGEERQKLGDSPSPEDLANLQRIATQKASQLLLKRRGELLLQFRNEVGPLARKIAKERNIQVLLVRNDMVLGIDPVADLTEMVIERMKSQPSPLAVPARTPSETPTTAPGS